MKWISMEDELPEIDFPLLLYSKMYGVQKGFRVTDRGKKIRMQIYGSGLRVNDVTHWMNLPSKP